MNDLDSYLETQYNNRAAVPEHGKYIQSWSDRSADYRMQATSAHLNLAYGDIERALLDIFPAQQLQAPVHVFIHGGYWQALSKDSFSFIAQTLNRQGECAVILNYGLCPQLSLAQISQQIFQAVRWVISHIAQYGGDPGNMQITGHSAGAHLMASLLTHDWSLYGLSQPPFRQMNALSGLYDLQPLLRTSINTALKLDQQSALDNSPLNSFVHYQAQDLKLRLIVGELESDEYKRQSQELLKHWQRHFNVSFQLLSEAHHFSILDTFLESDYQPLSAI